MDLISAITEPYFLVTLLVIFMGYFIFVFRPSNLLSSKNLPPGSFGFPFLGETISFIRAQRRDRTKEWIQSRVQKYGPVFKTSLMGCSAVILTGQAGNRFLLSNSDNGISGNQIATAKAILGRHSIFELSGSRHRLVRGAFVSFLKPESIRKFVGEMDALIQQLLLKEVEGKDSVPIVSLMKKITFKVTCSLLFGLPERKVKDTLFEDFGIALRGVWAIPVNFPGTTYNRALRARARIANLLSDLMDQRRKQLEESAWSDWPEDVVSSLLRLRDENGKGLLEEEIVDNLISMVIASHDTTTVLLSLLIRHLARDTEVSSKVYEEQRKAVEAREGREGDRLSWDEVQMMKYTWRVAQEVMRITPPVFGNFKSAFRDTSFQGFDIPKGWQVFWMSPSTHMDENIFQDPEKFDPARFEERSKSLPPYTYIPFGAGPRICPGAEFARIEVLLLIHHLITRYEWTEVVPGEPITRDPMPYPAKGLPVNLQPRN